MSVQIIKFFVADPGVESWQCMYDNTIISFEDFVKVLQIIDIGKIYQVLGWYQFLPRPASKPSVVGCGTDF